MTALLCLTKDPFLSWKRTERLLAGAAAHSLEIVVGLDETGTDPESDAERLVRLGANLVRFAGHGYCESALPEALDMVRDPWTLWASDDELPSEHLWTFRPPVERAFRISLVTLLPTGAHYGTNYQIRLFPTRSMHLTADHFEADLAWDVPVFGLPDLVLWHYYAFADRASREAKVRDYLRMEAPRGLPGYPDLVRTLYLWEDHPELRTPLAPELSAQLPQESVPKEAP